MGWNEVFVYICVQFSRLQNQVNRFPFVKVYKINYDFFIHIIIGIILLTGITTTKFTNTVRCQMFLENVFCWTFLYTSQGVY